MNLFRYRVLGKVDSQFCFRGMIFEKGRNIDFCVRQGEMEFLKEHCTITQITDFKAKEVAEIPKTLLNDEKGVDNGRRNKGTRARGNSRANSNGQQRVDKVES